MNDMIPTLVVCLILQINKKKYPPNVHKHNLFFLWSYIFFFSNTDAMRSRATAFFLFDQRVFFLQCLLWIFLFVSVHQSLSLVGINPLYLRKYNLGCKIFSCRKKPVINMKIFPIPLSSSSPFHCCLRILLLFMNIFWFTSVGVLIREFKFSDSKI